MIETTQRERERESCSWRGDIIVWSLRCLSKVSNWVEAKIIYWKKKKEKTYEIYKDIKIPRAHWPRRENDFVGCTSQPAQSPPHLPAPLVISFSYL